MAPSVNLPAVMNWAEGDEYHLPTQTPGWKGRRLKHRGSEKRGSFRDDAKHRMCEIRMQQMDGLACPQLAPYRYGLRVGQGEWQKRGKCLDPSTTTITRPQHLSEASGCGPPPVMFETSPVGHRPVHAVVVPVVYLPPGQSDVSQFGSMNTIIPFSDSLAVSFYLGGNETQSIKAALFSEPRLLNNAVNPSAFLLPLSQQSEESSQTQEMRPTLRWGRPAA